MEYTRVDSNVQAYNRASKLITISALMSFGLFIVNVFLLMYSLTAIDKLKNILHKLDSM